jgi:hypothetical protein
LFARKKEKRQSCTSKKQKKKRKKKKKKEHRQTYSEVECKGCKAGLLFFLQFFNRIDVIFFDFIIINCPGVVYCSN